MECFYDKNGNALSSGNSVEAHIPKTDYNPKVMTNY